MGCKRKQYLGQLGGVREDSQRRRLWIQDVLENQESEGQEELRGTGAEAKVRLSLPFGQLGCWNKVNTISVS